MTNSPLTHASDFKQLQPKPKPICVSMLDANVCKDIDDLMDIYDTIEKYAHITTSILLFAPVSVNVHKILTNNGFAIKWLPETRQYFISWKNAKAPKVKLWKRIKKFCKNDKTHYVILGAWLVFSLIAQLFFKFSKNAEATTISGLLLICSYCVLVIKILVHKHRKKINKV